MASRSKKSRAPVQPDVQPDVQPAAASRRISTLDRPIPYDLSPRDRPIPYALAPLAQIDPFTGAHLTERDLAELDPRAWVP